MQYFTSDGGCALDIAHIGWQNQLHSRAIIHYEGEQTFFSLNINVGHWFSDLKRATLSSCTSIALFHLLNCHIFDLKKSDNDFHSIRSIAMPVSSKYSLDNVFVKMSWCRMTPPEAFSSTATGRWDFHSARSVFKSPKIKSRGTYGSLEVVLS